MIIGIGVDLVECERFAATLESNPRLLGRLFTLSEIELNIASIAARFAAKEALMKAVGKAKGLSFQEVEIVKDKFGKPEFSLTGQTAQTILDRGITRLHLSLSHDGQMAIAYVIAEGS